MKWKKKTEKFERAKNSVADKWDPPVMGTIHFTVALD